jgi:oxalate---CoA ligase
MCVQTQETSVEKTLIRWWEDLLSAKEVGLDEDFFDLGGDSLIAARLFSNVKETYGIDLILSMIFEARTVRQLAAVISASNATGEVARQSPSVVRMSSCASSPPLFIVATVSGDVLYARELAACLGQRHALYGLLPIGLQARASRQPRIEDLATHYLHEMKRIQPQGPYALIGHCFGGIVAFEMAQQLIANCEEVSFLGLIETFEPGYLAEVDRAIRNVGLLKRTTSLLKFLLFDKNRWTGMKARFAARTFRIIDRLGLPLSQRFAKIGTVRDVNLFIASRYRAAAYSGPATIFRSSRRAVWHGDDELMGWGGLLRGTTEYIDVPGDHDSLLKEPEVQVLAEAMDRCLRACAMNFNLQIPADRGLGEVSHFRSLG